MSYLYDLANFFEGEYIDGESKARIKKKAGAHEVMHEAGHFIQDKSASSGFYGESIKEGLAQGLAMLGTRVFDQRHGTNYCFDSEGNTLLNIYMMYDYVSKREGFSQRKNLEPLRRGVGEMGGLPRVGKNQAGYALFQVMEMRSGEEIYKRILNKEDKDFDRFIYEGK